MLGSALLLRRTVASTARRRRDQHHRRLTAAATSSSPFKRALSERQLKGGNRDVGGVVGSMSGAPKPPTTTTVVPPASGGGSSTRPANVDGAVVGGGGDDGGGGGFLLPLLVLAGTGVGAAYYVDAIPEEYLPDALKRASPPPKKREEGGVARELREVVEEVVTKRDPSAVVAADRPAEARGAAAAFPATEEAVAAVDIDGPSEELVPPRDAPEAVVMASAVDAEGGETRPPAMAADAMSELRSSSGSRTLAAANAALLSSDLDDGSEYLVNVDGLSADQLRVRIAHLAAEMRNRTKWEAVRLREFLAMKEKEMEGRYLEVLQGQRLEFENLLAQRLREQEDVITRHANAALAAKEEGVQGLMKAASDARDREIEDALAMETKIVAEKLELDYQQRLENELAEMKEAYAGELDGYLSKMMSLQEKLDTLERRLEVSLTFESGSKKAHRVSAAALALANKLEVGEAAAVELAALRGAASDEGVIASAVSMIPRSANGGVPTLADLQATFDESYRIGREAAMVPEGRSGLNGQLLGILFAKLSVPPSPDSVPKSEEEGSVADGILSLARKYVHLGDLEKAVEELDRLKGQTAYVMNDWKTKAADRVSTERALKVIKLECALLNKDMVGSES